LTYHKILCELYVIAVLNDALTSVKQKYCSFGCCYTLMVDTVLSKFNVVAVSLISESCSEHCAFDCMLLNMHSNVPGLNSLVIQGCCMCVQTAMAVCTVHWLNVRLWKTLIAEEFSICTYIVLTTS
jgi:hypothetical protein